MKSFIQEYDIFDKKVKEDSNVVNIADIHDLSFSHMNCVIEDIRKINPSLVCIVGDTLQGFKLNHGDLDEIKKTLSAISEVCPVVLSLGNHDIYKINESGLNNYASLEHVRPGSVYPLNNESVVLGDYRVTGFCPRSEAFSSSLQANNQGNIYYVNDLISSGIKVHNDDKIEVMLCHSPHHFSFARQKCKNLKFYDLVLSGHLHNGFIHSKLTRSNSSKYMDRGEVERFYEHKDFIRPWVFAKTDLCRGVVYVGKNGPCLLILQNGDKYYIENGSCVKFQNTSKEKLDESFNHFVNEYSLVPIVITSGVNKYYSLPIDRAEVTDVHMKRLVK